MQVIFTKGTQHYGQLRCVRMDASATQTQMPEQNIAPQDMLHYVVEKRLHMQAFFSQIKAGADINAAHDHRQAAVANANQIDVSSTAMIVETLQSQLSVSESPSHLEFTRLLAQTCHRHNLPTPSVSQVDFEHILAEIAELSLEWQGLGEGQSLTLKF
jgi:hypothetical protein